MPSSRKADYYLGAFGGSVFIDINKTEDNLLYLKRISFDEFGCCDLGNNINTMNKEESKRFIIQLQKEIQALMDILIDSNKENIWEDALKKYGLLINN